MITKWLKKIITAFFLLYAFNMVAVKFNIVIPLNIWTIGVTTIFDIPGLAILLVLKTMGV